MAYQTTILKLSPLKYICNNKQFPFEEENKINKQ